jgi:segregation and condensation protein B
LNNPDITNIIESLIFASDEEISLKEIKDVLNSFKFSIEPEEIEEIIKDLNEKYDNYENAFRIIKVAGGFQFSTRKEFAQYVGKLYTEMQKKRLSPSAIETIAIISYKQPVTRSQIEFIRGVNVDYIVNSLLERDLIRIIGRENTPGRPILYGTTDKFLKVLGINSIEDLPKLKEINEILKTEKLEGVTQTDIDLYHSFEVSEQNPEYKDSQTDIQSDDSKEEYTVTDLENADNKDDTNKIDEAEQITHNDPSPEGTDPEDTNEENFKKNIQDDDIDKHDHQHKEEE